MAFLEGIEFAIGAKRIAPMSLSGLSGQDWTDAIDMDGAQVAVASYRPAWWPAKTEILIRRVTLDVSQVSADSRSRRRRTLHPDQRALPLGELAEADVYAYSFVCTNMDVSRAGKAVAVEHWYRQRTTIENLRKSTQRGCTARCWPQISPPGCTQLTATTGEDEDTSTNVAPGDHCLDSECPIQGGNLRGRE